VAREAEKDDVMRPVTLKLVWEVLPVECRDDVEPRVVLGFAAADALVLPVNGVESVIVEVLVGLHRPSAPIWLKIETNDEWLVADLLCKPLVNVPLGLLEVAV